MLERPRRACVWLVSAAVVERGFAGFSFEGGAECAFRPVPELGGEFTHAEVGTLQRALRQHCPPSGQVRQRCDARDVPEAVREARPRHPGGCSQIDQCPRMAGLVVDEPERGREVLVSEQTQPPRRRLRLLQIRAEDLEQHELPVLPDRESGPGRGCAGLTEQLGDQERESGRRGRRGADVDEAGQRGAQQDASRLVDVDPAADEHVVPSEVGRSQRHGVEAHLGSQLPPSTGTASSAHLERRAPVEQHHVAGSQLNRALHAAWAIDDQLRAPRHEGDHLERPRERPASPPRAGACEAARHKPPHLDPLERVRQSVEGGSTGHTPYFRA